MAQTVLLILLLPLAGFLLLLLFGRRLGEPVAGCMEANSWQDWWPHLFYLNGLMDRPWLMQIYWTLALEAQYYLAIGLLFPLLVHRKPWIRALALALVILVPLAAHDGRTVLPFAALFALGMVIFLKMSRRLPGPLCWVLLLVCTGVTWRALGAPQAFTALVSAAAILVLPLRHRFLTWLGEISYPFYLFHLVVAGLLMPWLISLPRQGKTDTLAVLGLFALSLGLSWILHRWIEVPVQRWSSAIRYRRHDR